MLQKEKSKKVAILKYGLSVPLFLLAMILSSATISKNETIEQVAEVLKPKLEISEILVPEKVIEQGFSNIKNKINLETKVDTVKVEVKPKFPGGNQAFSNFLAQNLRYPKQAKDAQIQGKVIVRFLVDLDGSLSDIEVLKGIGNGCDEEAIRVLKLSPKWEPAILNGKKVKVQQTLPINFLTAGNLSNTNKDGEVVVNAYLTALNEVKVANDEDDDKVYQNPEILPVYIGGLKEFSEFLEKNLKYPAEAKNAKIGGRVYCTFVVEKDGSLSNIKVVRGIGYGCDEEAVRVLAITPKWKPGQNEGKAVRVSYTIPIFFQLPSGSNVKNDSEPTEVEVLPSFPGGLEAFAKFLSQNIKYPADAKKNKIQGRVYCQFIVETDGSLTDIKVVRGIGGGCDEEALRVMKLSPKWSPGVQNGKKVRVSYTLPIFFSLK